MKILQICTKVTSPAKDGYSIAVNAISKGLTKEANYVRIMSANTLQHFVKETEMSSDYIKNYKPVTVTLDTYVKPLPAFINLFTSKSYNIERFISNEFKSKLSNLLIEENFDLIQFESLFMAPYLETVRKYSKAKAVLRAHNVEHLIWERRYQEEKNPFRKWYLVLLKRRLMKYEENIINKFDGIAAISDIDKQYFKEMGCRIPIETIPIGIDYEFINNDKIKPEPSSLFFIGTLDWMPNVDGLKWFLNECWEEIHKVFPFLNFYIAGKYSNNFHLDKEFPNVTIVGEIDNAYEFICSKEIMIVPLKYASGTRVKIIEAMALGKVIITTNIGLEGINAKNGENILIADFSNEFVEVISKYLNDKNLLKIISDNAKKFAYENYNNTDIIKKLLSLYNTLL